MRFLPRLLRRVYRALDTTPHDFTALAISHPSGGAWSIREAVLTLTPATIPAPAPVTIPLASHTMATLATALVAAGWNVERLDASQRDRGAIALLEGAWTSQDTPTGALAAHDSLLWALFDTWALELGAAQDVVAAAPAQLITTEAEGEWLDEHGRYYDVPRLPGEPDILYGPRIIEEVLRPKSNNVAMAAIIEQATGQSTIVRDVTVYGPVVPSYDGAITHNAAYTHSATEKAIYGLFDVETAFALEGLDANFTVFRATIAEQVKRLKLGGTLLRDVIVNGGNLADTAPGPQADPADTVSMGLAYDVALTEAAAAPAEAADFTMGLSLGEAAAGGTEATTLTSSYTHILNGAWQLNGMRPLSSGLALADSF